VGSISFLRLVLFRSTHHLRSFLVSSLFLFLLCFASIRVEFLNLLVCHFQFVARITIMSESSEASSNLGYSGVRGDDEYGNVSSSPSSSSVAASGESGDRGAVDESRGVPVADAAGSSRQVASVAAVDDERVPLVVVGGSTSGLAAEIPVSEDPGRQQRDRKLRDVKVVADSCDTRYRNGSCSDADQERLKMYSCEWGFEHLDYAFRLVGKKRKPSEVTKDGCSVVFYEECFKGGLRLPLAPFFCRVLRYFGLAWSQLAANTWRVLVSYVVFCQYKGWTPSIIVIRCLYFL